MRELDLSPDTDFEAGVVIPLDKPLGWTSADVVRKVKFALHRLGHRRIKIGHAGTLDPLATGVLLLCVGKATKQADRLQGQPKEYEAQITLGATTPSGDMEHPVDHTYPWEHITRPAVEKALAGLTGERLQTPPVYSAKMIEGRRAYDYAREGEAVQMRQALVNIYSIELLAFEPPAVRVRVRCSKGTYIRSLAIELGEALASGGYLTALRRTGSGSYGVEDCFGVEEILEKIADRNLARP